MSISIIPYQTRYILWGKAAGRCQYAGCNKMIYLDNVTQAEYNQAYIAHIIGDKPDGPRGDKVLSPLMATSIDNLMLMCDSHHRKIDNNNGKDYSVEVLREMKKVHEERIKLVTDITDTVRSHILLYGANVGQLQNALNWREAASAIISHSLPAEPSAIEFGLVNSFIKDDNPLFWTIESENLKQQYETRLHPRIAKGEISHMSIFGIAPQPLLILLGTLLSDLRASEVYQRQREPEPSWKWQSSQDDFNFNVIRPDKIHPTVALNLSISGTILPSRITSVLGEAISIWTVTIPTPNNDCIKSREQLVMFRQTMRLIMDQIKTTHPDSDCIHIFPAVPVSVAIELGRIRMPKADLPFILYDQNFRTNSFIRAIDIGAKS
ncbi:HNH endonuclease [Paenibacillus sp. S150]|uniref:HNH endonuclease n=1 Tax=Paenibacillus sp. S150 TaxID=2749826 RepID=UPI001C58AAA9|nr:HNH endonuclease [Paenibacillus sp. S150]MBW4079993.1 HNH endonuclease [Paenibacillus sp. S150]